MIRYVAFLRGININGHRKVSMVELKKTFEKLEFKSVATYINSGNVIFSHIEQDPDKIVKRIEEGIKKDYQFEVKVLVRDFENLLDVCRKIPVSWERDPSIKPQVVFLFKEIDSINIINEIAIDPKIDKVKYVSGALLWNMNMRNYSKSSFYKFISTKITKQVTIRSINTVRKLNQMMSI